MKIYRVGRSFIFFFKRSVWRFSWVLFFIVTWRMGGVRHRWQADDYHQVREMVERLGADGATNILVFEKK